MRRRKWEKIWTEIAEAWDNAEISGPCYCANIRGNLVNGLCWSLTYIVDVLDANCQSETYQIPEILFPVETKEFVFWWDNDAEGAAYRATFAGLMAAMGDKGFQEFLDWCQKDCGVKK
jgi:hypothetical protein